MSDDFKVTAASGMILVSGIALQVPPQGQIPFPIPTSAFNQSENEKQQTAAAVFAAVSYWTKTIGARIIEYDSVNKKYHRVR
jgi:hypothetical protein